MENLQGDTVARPVGTDISGGGWGRLAGSGVKFERAKGVPPVKSEVVARPRFSKDNGECGFIKGHGLRCYAGQGVVVMA